MLHVIRSGEMQLRNEMKMTETMKLNAVNAKRTIYGIYGIRKEKTFPSFCSSAVFGKVSKLM
jgi:hypothetical protein